MLGEYDFWAIVVICIAACYAFDNYCEYKYGRGKDDE